MDYQSFWKNNTYAFVGHSAKKKFPEMSYGMLRDKGKKIYPVDPSIPEIKGNKTYPDLASLPEKVDAVVIETPKKETKDWVEKAAAAGINNVWIDMTSDTDEAISFAREKGMNILYGTCAVMYLYEGFSFHSFHKWINKRLGKY